MMRIAAALGLLLVAPVLAAEPKPMFEALPLAAPARGGGVVGPSMARATNGAIWLTWLERAAGETALKFSIYDTAGRRWTAAQTIAHARDWIVNAADFPCLALGEDGKATAAWPVVNGETGRAMFSRTTDGGGHWSAPASLSHESQITEFVSLAALADGRTLAVWLDGRGKGIAGGAVQLFSRIIEGNSGDVLVDRSVCECCQTALTAFPDGTALLAYRGRGDGEVRDIRVTRFRGTRWDEPKPLNNDDWRIAGCPVNGPQLISDGGRVAAAWFTAAEDEPRVLASYSPDAGGRFLIPLRVTDGNTLGRVATALLHDGAILVTSVDADGGLWLRRLSPEFVATAPLLLHPAAGGRVKGFPRIALARDYAGGDTVAELLVAFTAEGEQSLQTLRVTIPEGQLLEAEKNCDCSPTTDQLMGFPIRGTIVSADASRGTVQIQHFEVPGIFAEGSREFKATPETLARADHAGRQFLGRVEKRGRDWWLSDVRLIASAPR